MEDEIIDCQLAQSLKKKNPKVFFCSISSPHGNSSSHPFKFFFSSPKPPVFLQRLSDSAQTENLPEPSAVVRKHKVSQACLTRGRIKLTALEKREMLDITVWESGQRAQQDL